MLSSVESEQRQGRPARDRAELNLVVCRPCDPLSVMATIAVQLGPQAVCFDAFFAARAAVS